MFLQGKVLSFYTSWQIQWCWGFSFCQDFGQITKTPLYYCMHKGEYKIIPSQYVFERMSKNKIVKTFRFA